MMEFDFWIQDLQDTIVAYFMENLFLLSPNLHNFLGVCFHVCSDFDFATVVAFKRELKKWV